MEQLRAPNTFSLPVDGLSHLASPTNGRGASLGSLLLDAGANEGRSSHQQEPLSAKEGTVEGAVAPSCRPPPAQLAPLSTSTHVLEQEDTLSWLMCVEYGMPCTVSPDLQFLSPSPHSQPAAQQHHSMGPVIKREPDDMELDAPEGRNTRQPSSKCDQELLEFMQRPLDLQQLGLHARGDRAASCALGSTEGALRAQVDHKPVLFSADKDSTPSSHGNTSLQMPQGACHPPTEQAGSPAWAGAARTDASQMATKGDSPPAPQTVRSQQQADKGRSREGGAMSEEGELLSKRHKVTKPRPIKREAQSPQPVRVSARLQQKQQQEQGLEGKEREHEAVRADDSGSVHGAGREGAIAPRGATAQRHDGVVSVAMAVPASEAQALEAEGRVDVSARVGVRSRQAAASVPKVKAEGAGAGRVRGGVANLGGVGPASVGRVPSKKGSSARGPSQDRCADAVAEALAFCLPDFMSHPPAATESDLVGQLNVVEGRIADFALSLVDNLLQFLLSMGYSEDQAHEIAGGCLNSISEFEARPFKVILKYSHFVLDDYVNLMRTGYATDGLDGVHEEKAAWISRRPSRMLSLILSKDMGPWLLDAHKAQLKKSALEVWALMHIWDPWPDPDVKDSLAAYTGRSRLQVTNWFTNWRQRSWKPLVKHIGQCIDLLEAAKEDSDTDTSEAMSE